MMGGVSRPTRARGLKRSDTVIRNWINRVAPHAGAWIETQGYQINL